MPTELLMDMLREQTRKQHQKVDSSEFFSALLMLRLPLESYIGFLKTMAVVNYVLEHELNRNNIPEINKTWQAARMTKSLHIRKDLSYFEPMNILDIGSNNDDTIQLASTIREWSHSEPIRLLGCLYVIEGSMQGARILKPKLAESYGLKNDSGLSYFTVYGAQSKKQWDTFKQNMNELTLSERNRDIIIDTAQEFFAAIENIIRHLFPVSVTFNYSANHINPSAGNYRVSADPRELLAAFDAGEISYQKIPYYKERYGEHGTLFTRSDSAWLVTLTEKEMNSLYKQILWIGDVMSSRGMPRILLEQHLGDLYNTLIQIIPERQPKYEKLRLAARKLRAEYRKWISQDDFEALASEFETNVINLSVPLKNTGPMIIAAMIDQKNGITRAVPSLIDWLTDKDRFPSEWISAVRDITQKTLKKLNDSEAEQQTKETLTTQQT